MRNEQKDLAEQKSTRVINILVEVLVCSIAEYFHELCRILTSPMYLSKDDERNSLWLTNGVSAVMHIDTV